MSPPTPVTDHFVPPLGASPRPAWPYFIRLLFLSIFPPPPPPHPLSLCLSLCLSLSLFLFIFLSLLLVILNWGLRAVTAPLLLHKCSVNAPLLLRYFWIRAGYGFRVDVKQFQECPSSFRAVWVRSQSCPRAISVQFQSSFLSFSVVSERAVSGQSFCCRNESLSEQFPSIFRAFSEHFPSIFRAISVLSF